MSKFTGKREILGPAEHKSRRTCSMNVYCLVNVSVVFDDSYLRNEKSDLMNANLFCYGFVV